MTGRMVRQWLVCLVSDKQDDMEAVRDGGSHKFGVRRIETYLE